MNTVFKYTLLQYIHSQTWGESINIGVLIFFPEHHKVIFKYSDKINNLKYIYPAFVKSNIELYLKGFRKKADNISSNYTVFSENEIKTNIEKYVQDEFLPEDATALQFSQIYTSLLYSPDLNKIINNLYNRYFPSHKISNINEKHDDEFLLKTIHSLVREKNHELTRHFQRNVEVKSSDTSLTFDMAWKNGSTNLVKPVSFDLSNSANIHRKADRFFGTLFFLENEAKANNYRFDLLVARPQDKKLFKAYDKALNKLEKIPSPKKIVEESDFDNYIDQALNQLTLFSN